MTDEGLSYFLEYQGNSVVGFRITSLRWLLVDFGGGVDMMLNLILPTAVYDVSINPKAGSFTLVGKDGPSFRNQSEGIICCLYE
jgi:hypothetical protein